MKPSLASLLGLLTNGPALSVIKGWVFLEGRWEIKHKPFQSRKRSPWPNLGWLRGMEEAQAADP